MEFKETRLKGVYTIDPNVFKDRRGFFLEFFHAFGARHDVSCSGHSAELACAWRWVPEHIIGPLGDQKVTPSVIVVGQGLGFETA